MLTDGSALTDNCAGIAGVSVCDDLDLDAVLGPGVQFINNELVLLYVAVDCGL